MKGKRQNMEALAEGLDQVEYDVPPEHEGERADRFLCWCVPRLTRSRAQAIIRAGALQTSEGRVLKPSTSMQAGWKVLLTREAPDDPPPLSDLVVLHEDAHVVVVDKPGHLVMHRTARHVHRTVEALLSRAYGEPGPQPAHRLDLETSGVVMCSRTREAHAFLTAQFEQRTTSKLYYAVVEGDPPFESRQVDLPMCLDPDNEVSVTMCVHPEGLRASTRFEVVRRGAAGRTLMRCELLTGRQHQIRVHLAAIGLPIVGDKLYGPDAGLFLAARNGGLDAEQLARLGHHRQALHAWRLEIPHPANAGDLSAPRAAFEAPLPEELADLVDRPALRFEPSLIRYDLPAAER